MLALAVVLPICVAVPGTAKARRKCGGEMRRELGCDMLLLLATRKYFVVDFALFIAVSH